ncbi:MAG: carotenoid biosynthesis protein [Mycobacteriales bacterium]
MTAAKARWLPAVLALVTVLLQIAYPLLSGHPRNVLTVITVVVFFLASATHAVVHRGVRWALLFVAVTAGFGLGAEAVGTATGFPFGHYSYASSLGAKAFGVPLAIPLAWSMMAYPCLLVGQSLGGSRGRSALVGGYALASWDLFLDPQMVAAGHWHWTSVRHALPGAPHVPVSNYLGWLAVALLMLAVLQQLPRHRADDRQPAALFGWTYASSVLANVAFFGRPLTALIGGAGMGLVAIPYALSLRR